MSVLVKQVEDKLCELVRDAAKKAMAAGELPEAELTDFKVEIPADRKNGDYSTNAAMAWARAFRRAPAMIAAAITKNIDLEGTAFSSCEAAGPGFINFRLADRFYSEILMDIRKKGSDYGRSNFGKGEKVNIEFVSANPTGPMHMGNARGGALGDCLAAVMDFAGYNVSREFYINDAGNQIDKFALSLDIRYQQIYKGADAPELPEDSYHGEDIAVRAREFADVYGDKYISESEEVRRKALVDFALPKNIDSMHEILSKYRIEYDTWFKESTLHNGTELRDTIELLKEKGLTYELDGALWYKNIEVQTKRLLAQGKTQEEIDKTIAMYEETLADIKNGIMYSKSVDGDDQLIMSYTPADISTSTDEKGLYIKLDNGKEYTFGPYETDEALLTAVKPFCEKQVRLGNMTQSEADEIIARHSGK